MTEDEFILYVRQKLTELATAMMRYYDPCKIHDDQCKAGTNPCCIAHTIFSKGPCPFLIEGKCTYENPDCKTWLCQTAIEGTDTKCIEGLKLLEKFGALYNVIRPPFIGESYVGADKQPSD